MLGQASPRHLSWPLSSQLWEKSLWQEKSFKLFYLSTTVLLSHFVSSQTKVSSAPLECLDVYYAYRLHAIHFLKAMTKRISLRYLGTPDCILWSVRFFLTPWERDNIIIRNLVILQSDYMHRVFRLRHLPIAQVASALAFFSFRYWTVFSQSAKAWLRCQLSHLAGPSLPQQSMVTHPLVRISWQTPKLILNTCNCAPFPTYALGTKILKLFIHLR